MILNGTFTWGGGGGGGAGGGGGGGGGGGAWTGAWHEEDSFWELSMPLPWHLLQLRPSPCFTEVWWMAADLDRASCTYSGTSLIIQVPPKSWENQALNGNSITMVVKLVLVNQFIHHCMNVDLNPCLDEESGSGSQVCTASSRCLNTPVCTQARHRVKITAKVSELEKHKWNTNI